MPNGAVYQGNYNTNRVGGGEASERAGDRYETRRRGSAPQNEKTLRKARVITFSRTGPA